MSASPFGGFCLTMLLCVSYAGDARADDVSFLPGDMPLGTTASIEAVPVVPGGHFPTIRFSKTTDSGSGSSRTPFTITPYGSLWANMVYATHRTAPGEFTFWVLPERDQGEAAFTIDARRTRIGIDIVGPQQDWFGGVETGGQVEIDFFGEFITENRAGARLRHAWWEARNDDYRLLIGQTWDVISPLRPGTLNFSVGWNGGNIGFRRAQFRLERFIQLDHQRKLTLQAAVSQDIISDFPTDPGIRRETANWPVLQGRTALSFNSANGTFPKLTVGLSGHVGETGFDFLTPGPPPFRLPPADDERFETWSGNVDVRLQYEKFTVQGELFYGANLSAFMGGIGQGVCPCLRESIHSTGGWLEAVYQWTPRWESHLGFGIDDPANHDSLLGRIRNQFIFGNLIWHVTPKLDTGFEMTWWETDYQEQRSGLINPALLTPDERAQAVTLEWMVKYDF
jgi:hypothetical protein